MALKLMQDIEDWSLGGVLDGLPDVTGPRMTKAEIEAIEHALAGYTLLPSGLSNFAAPQTILSYERENDSGTARICAKFSKP